MSKTTKRMAVLAILVIGASATAAELAADAMVLVQVQVDGNGASVIAVKVVDGRAKRPRAFVAQHDELRFDVVDMNGRITFSGTVTDPTRVELEYFNEDGTIGRIVETKESGIAHIRIPFDPSTVEIRLARMVLVEEGPGVVLKAESLGRMAIELDADVADE